MLLVGLGALAAEFLGVAVALIVGAIVMVAAAGIVWLVWGRHGDDPREARVWTGAADPGAHAAEGDVWVQEQSRAPERRSDGPVRVRAGIDEGILMATLGPGGSEVWRRDAALWVYNAGSSRFTVNEAGWLGTDGERLRGRPSRPQPVEPGAPEQEYRVDASEAVTFMDAHGGIDRIYVVLAGDTTPQTFPIDSAWVKTVRETAQKPGVTYS